STPRGAWRSSRSASATATARPPRSNAPNSGVAPAGPQRAARRRFVSRLDVAPAGRLRLGRGRSRTSRRHGGAHAGATARMGVDHERAATGLDPLTHLAQAQTARAGHAVPHGSEFEAGTVVSHLHERHAAVVGPNVYFHETGAPMP